MNPKNANKRVIGLSLLLLAVLITPVMLNMNAAAGREDAAGGAVSLLQLSAGFFFVLALIALMAWAAKSWLLPAMKTGAAQRELRLVEKLVVNQQATIVLVRACEKKLLIGISGDSMQVLSELAPDPEEHDKNEPGDVPTVSIRKSHRFAQFLEKAQQTD